VVDLGSEVVVNAPMLDAMILLAEPDGTQTVVMIGGPFPGAPLAAVRGEYVRQ
jgi:succinyl-CoA synthetase alpha subunit